MRGNIGQENSEDNLKKTEKHENNEIRFSAMEPAQKNEYKDRSRGSVFLWLLIAHAIKKNCISAMVP